MCQNPFLVRLFDFAQSELSRTAPLVPRLSRAHHERRMIHVNFTAEPFVPSIDSGQTLSGLEGRAAVSDLT